MDPQPAAATTCYRHPDRATRLSCTTCGRSICVECSHDAVVGQKCPECARPDRRAQVIDARTAARAGRHATPVTLALISVNAAVFLIGTLFADLGDRFFVEGAQFRPLIERGEWWRVLTAMFLHSGITHILFNMWALWLFGPSLERRWGGLPFVSLYVSAGLGGAALFHLLGRNVPAVGASGAIFGLFGALLIVSYRQRQSPAGRAMFSQLLLLLAVNLSLPFVLDRIAWEAHLGGLIVGLVIGAAWDRMPRRGPSVPAQRAALGFAIAAAAFAVVLLV